MLHWRKHKIICGHIKFTFFELSAKSKDDVFQNREVQEKSHLIAQYCVIAQYCLIGSHLKELCLSCVY